MGKPAHDTAMFWHSIWLSCGKPSTGWVWEIRRRTRAQYHKIVKDLKKNDSLNKSEKMADAIIANDNRNFWREDRKINPKKKTIPNTTDGVKGDTKISEMFADKYNGLYNSVPYDVDAMKIGKHDGDPGLESDHLIYSTILLHRLLSDFIGFSLRHSHMAECITVSHIVSIPKDGRGSMISSDNYKGICLCSSILKLIDIIILNKKWCQTKNVRFIVCILSWNVNYNVFKSAYGSCTVT